MSARDHSCEMCGRGGMNDIEDTLVATNEQLRAEIEKLRRGAEERVEMDMNFIASARTTLPALITELEEARAERNDAQAAMRALALDIDKANKVYMDDIRRLGDEAENWRKSHEGQTRRYTIAFYDCEKLKAELATAREVLCRLSRSEVHMGGLWYRYKTEYDTLDNPIERALSSAKPPTDGAGKGG